MANNESANTAISIVALIIGIIAILGFVYLYLNQNPVNLTSIEDDIKDIESNYNLEINNLQTDLENFDEKIDDIEDYLLDEINDINCDDCDDGEDWYDMSEDEYECLMESISVECENTPDTGPTHTHDTNCEVIIDFDNFEDCLD